MMRTLATMVGAGIPLHRALGILAEQMPDNEQARVESMALQLQRGHSFSSTVASHPDLFGPLHRALLKVGEMTGGLVRLLDRLADYDEKNEALRGRLRSRLTYPAVLFVVACLAMLVLPPLVLEGMLGILASSPQPPPLLTQLVIKLASLLRNPVFVVGAVALGVAGLGAGRQLWANRSLRLATYRLVEGLPVAGRVVRQVSQARFCDALGLQLMVGVPPLQALPLAAAATANPLWEEDIARAIRALEEGATVAEALEVMAVVDPLLVSLVAVGEESGKLSEILTRAGVAFEQSVEHSVEVLTSLAEPLTLFFMGCIFAVLIVATMLPMVQLVENL
ncbi:MAG: type II secretion system F family protein [Candidatus Eremiobacteraeota bacterium]|nr:type II secretion system F family protein [Candidatus Eremiobacteraeota bacterium]